MKNSIASGGVSQKKCTPFRDVCQKCAVIIHLFVKNCYVSRYAFCQRIHRHCSKMCLSESATPVCSAREFLRECAAFRNVCQRLHRFFPRCVCEKGVGKKVRCSSRSLLVTARLEGRCATPQRCLDWFTW
jgi:hypothetical protein